MKSVKILPEAQSLSVIILGRFNPAIFQPMWFASQDIITETEAMESAEQKTGLIHPEIALFDTDWFHLEVGEDKFVVNTGLDAYFTRLKEFVFLTFTALKHTPVSAIGINPEAHFKLQDEAAVARFTDQLAPVSVWEKISKEKPLLRHLAVEEPNRGDGFKGSHNYFIQNSTKVKNGIQVRMNSHYDLKDDKGNGTDKLLEVLDKGWEPSLEKWNQVYNHFTDLVR